MERSDHINRLEELSEQLLINQIRYSKQISQLTDFLSASGEYSILYFLFQENRSFSPGEFAERLNITPGRVANLLKALEKKSLINRQKDPADGRRNLVTLTDQGKEYVSSIYEKSADFYHCLIEAIGENDTREFLRITNKILEASRILQ